MSIRCGLLLLILTALPLVARGGAPVYLVDDFEDGDHVSRSGASWAPFCDAILGGASTVRLEIAGPKGKRALHAAGTVAPNGFAGTWVALDRDARAVDLHEFTAIRLRLRGEGEWRVGLRGGSSRFDNYMAAVNGTKEWKSVEVPLSSLRAKAAEEAPDLKEVRWLGIQSAPGRTGAVSFELDDVELVGAAQPGPPHGNALQARVGRTPLRAFETAAWKPIGSDPAGDGKSASLPDLVSLESFTDGDVVWLRLGLAAAPGPAFGLNVVLDTDGDPSNGQPWWGVNTAFRFDVLVTAWVFETTDDALEGTIGIASASDAVSGRMIDPALGMPRLAVDAAGKRIYVGVPRAALVAAASVRLVAAVGSPMKHNDDLPDAGAVTFTP